MMTILRTLLILKLCQFVKCLETSTMNYGMNASDIESALSEYRQMICRHEPTCHLIQDFEKPYAQMPYRNCMCDADCAEYADCCPDSLFYNKGEQSRRPGFRCMRVSADQSFYVIHRCPPHYDRKNVADLCENPAAAFDFIATTPVTDEGGAVYANAFCALCNGVEYDFWDKELSCKDEGDERVDFVDVKGPTPEELVQNLVYNRSGNLEWISIVNNTKYPCQVHSAVPDGVRSKLRPCVAGISSDCESKPEVALRAECQSYTSLTYDDGDRVYRNPACYACSKGLSWKEVKSVRKGCPPPSAPVQQFPFATVVSVTALSKKVPAKACVSYAKMLAHICEPPPAATKRTKCPKIEHLKKEQYYVKEDKSLIALEYDVMFAESDYHIVERTGLAIVCLRDGKVFETFFERMAGTVTTIGISISIAFLALHLIAFARVKEMRNLSGKNLASFSLALLVAYASFLLGNFLEEGRCFFNAVITYYCFLVVFSWMLTISVDVWCCLWKAASRLQTPTPSDQRKKFLWYSACSWCIPACVVAAAVAFDSTDMVEEKYRPRFGRDSCWFGKSQHVASFLFFLLPSTTIFAANWLFFGMTAFIVYKHQSQTVNPKTKNDFVLYVRLALLTGLTWITASIAAWTDWRILWFVFIVLNTSQGLFIFLAFTCKGSVLRAIREQFGIIPAACNTSRHPSTTLETSNFRDVAVSPSAIASQDEKEEHVF